MRGIRGKGGISFWLECADCGRCKGSEGCMKEIDRVWRSDADGRSAPAVPCKGSPIAQKVKDARLSIYFLGGTA